MWWPETGSNRRRRPFQGRALPLSYLALGVAAEDLRLRPLDAAGVRNNLLSIASRMRAAKLLPVAMRTLRDHVGWHVVPLLAFRALRWCFVTDDQESLCAPEPRWRVMLPSIAWLSADAGVPLCLCHTVCCARSRHFESSEKTALRVSARHPGLADAECCGHNECGCAEKFG